jgi:hypothetical protein
VNKIYVVSKTKHALMWKAARLTYPVIVVSSWIDDGSEDEIDFTEAWPRYLKEAASATHVVVHTEPGEELKGGLFEIGAALGAGARVFISGPVPSQMRTLVQHPNVIRVGSPWEAFQAIQMQATPTIREGERASNTHCSESARSNCT